MNAAIKRVELAAGLVRHGREQIAAVEIPSRAAEARTLLTRSPMDTIMKIACIALFVPAMWAWHAVAKTIATQFGVVGGLIAFAAIFAAACLMDRRS